MEVKMATMKQVTTSSPPNSNGTMRLAAKSGAAAARRGVPGAWARCLHSSSPLAATQPSHAATRWSRVIPAVKCRGWCGWKVDMLEPFGVGGAASLLPVFNLWRVEQSTRGGNGFGF